jgi:hypothetical protein
MHNIRILHNIEGVKVVDSKAIYKRCGNSSYMDYGNNTTFH